MQQFQSPIQTNKDINIRSFWADFLVTASYSWTFAPIIVGAGFDGVVAYPGPGLFLLQPFSVVFLSVQPFAVFTVAELLLFALCWTIAVRYVRGSSIQKKILVYFGVYIIFAGLIFGLYNGLAAARIGQVDGLEYPVSLTSYHARQQAKLADEKRAALDKQIADNQEKIKENSVLFAKWALYNFASRENFSMVSSLIDPTTLASQGASFFEDKYLNHWQADYLYTDSAGAEGQLGPNDGSGGGNVFSSTFPTPVETTKLMGSDTIYVETFSWTAYESPPQPYVALKAEIDIVKRGNRYYVTDFHSISKVVSDAPNSN